MKSITYYSLCIIISTQFFYSNGSTKSPTNEICYISYSSHNICPSQKRHIEDQQIKQEQKLQRFLKRKGT